MKLGPWVSEGHRKELRALFESTGPEPDTRAT